MGVARHSLLLPVTSTAPVDPALAHPGLFLAAFPSQARPVPRGRRCDEPLKLSAVDSTRPPSRDGDLLGVDRGRARGLRRGPGRARHRVDPRESRGLPARRAESSRRRRSPVARNPVVTCAHRLPSSPTQTRPPARRRCRPRPSPSPLPQLQALVPTRTLAQIRTHAQRYLARHAPAADEAAMGEASSSSSSSSGAGAVASVAGIELRAGAHLRHVAIEPAQASDALGFELEACRRCG